MAKELPRVTVVIQPEALWDVLQKIKSMPGVIDLVFHLDDPKAVVPATTAPHSKPPVPGVTAEQAVLDFLKDGPKHIQAIVAHVGGSKSRAYGAAHQLRKKGLAEAGPGKAMHQLTRLAMKQLPIEHQPQLALPSPKTNGHKANGHADIKRRASPGAVRKTVLVALSSGSKKRGEISKLFEAEGLSEKGISGALERARVDGVVKSDGKGVYTLTGRGEKEAAALQAASLNGAQHHQAGA